MGAIHPKSEGGTAGRSLVPRLCTSQTLSHGRGPPAWGGGTCLTESPIQVLGSPRNTLTHTQKQCLIWAPAAGQLDPITRESPHRPFWMPPPVGEQLMGLPERTPPGALLSTHRGSFTAQPHAPGLCWTLAGVGREGVSLRGPVSSPRPGAPSLWKRREQVWGPAGSLCQRGILRGCWRCQGMDCPLYFRQPASALALVSFPTLPHSSLGFFSGYNQILFIRINDTITVSFHPLQP